MSDDKSNEVQKLVWEAHFTEAVQLIRHDDVLNWQKFHYMLFVFGALLTAYGWNLSQPDGRWILCIVLGVFGAILSWGADLTFQEGLRCLRAHRRKLAALEKNSPPENVTFLLSNNAYNQRDVLESGPIVMFLLSCAMIVLALVKFGAVTALT